MVVTLAIVVLSGVVLQLLNELAAAFGTRTQVDTGQRMVYDLRGRLFQHLQALGLHHHITTNTGDAVYRIDVDSYAIENLVMSGIIPLASSIATLAVMFVDSAPARSDRRAAVAVGRAVPVPVPALLHEHHRGEERAGQRARVEADCPALRGVQRHPAREELRARTVRDPRATRAFGSDVMNARIAITWQESLFGVAVALVTILGHGARRHRRRHARAQRRR